MKTHDEHIQRYLATRQKIADLEAELKTQRDELMALGAYESDHFKVAIIEARREYLKSVAELKSKFTPTQLKGLLGISKVSTLRVTEKK